MNPNIMLPSLLEIRDGHLIFMVFVLLNKEEGEGLTREA